MNRRNVLRLGAAATGVGALGAGWPLAGKLLTPGQPGKLLRSHAPLPAAYQVQLPVPAQLAPVRADATTDYYEITQQVAELRILPGLSTAAWTYGGSFPGPTIVSRSGRRTVTNHRNDLPQPVVVHLHGGHTPADSDGYPIDLIMPTSGAMPAGHDMAGMTGDMSLGQRSYAYPMNQRAATLWYHDHRMGRTGQAVWRGLAGFHLVHDDEEDALPLPRGQRDIPLMITDRSCPARGALQ
jgi:FtsP/CotA-like multicopper oxidase with cupredoxin domain